MLKLRVYKPVRSTRVCGECTACCTTLSVTSLQKPTNVRCQHVCERGCSIYDRRPQECRDFQCAWLDGLIPEQFRPDRAGVVWNLQPVRAPNGAWVVQAMLVHDQVTIDQVEYQFVKLQRSVADALVCQIIPPQLTCRSGGTFHSQLVRPNIYLANRAEDDAASAAQGK